MTEGHSGSCGIARLPAPGKALGGSADRDGFGEFDRQSSAGQCCCRRPAFGHGDLEVSEATVSRARPGIFTWLADARGWHLRTNVRRCRTTAAWWLRATHPRTHGAARVDLTLRADDARRATRRRRPWPSAPHRSRARRVPALWHPCPWLCSRT